MLCGGWQRGRCGSPAGPCGRRELTASTQPPTQVTAPSHKPGQADAADLQSLLEGRLQLWLVEFSAVLSGWRFVSCCRALGLDPHALPLVRREAIDTAMMAPLGVAAFDHEDHSLAELEARLRGLLVQRLH